MNSIAIFSFIAVLQSVPQTPESVAPDSYLDAEAAGLVAGARAASDSANATIAGYDVLARQRITAGVHVVGRSRPLFRQELAADLAWRRGGPHRVEVLGAREAVPVARVGVSASDDPGSDAADLLFDPTELFLLRIGSRQESARRTPGDRRRTDEETRSGVEEPAVEAGNGDEDDGDDDFDMEVRHPLAAGSEEHYRYRTGERTTIRLQDGRTIRLIELEIHPRRSSPRLVEGSFWLEEGTYRAVRGVFTLAAPLTVRVPPRGSRLPIPSLSASFDIRHVTVEYALWESRWWMPRLTSFEGSGRVAGVTGSVVFEQLYENYRVYSTEDTIPAAPAPDTALVDIDQEECETEEPDCEPTYILVPRDTAVLVSGPHLPGSIYSDEGRLADDRTLLELAALIDARSSRALAARTPRVDWALFDASLLRFNRVEGLTLGGTASVETAPYTLSLAAWAGTAAPAPSARLALSRTGYAQGTAIELYRRVEAFTPEDRPFSLGSSVGAFFFGRDEGDYYRSSGVGVTRTRGAPAAPGMVIRIYHEWQEALETGTNLSVPNWIDDRRARPNPTIPEGWRSGMEFRLRRSFGLDPTGYRFAGDVGGQIERGGSRFGRISSNAYLSFPLPGRLLGAVEVGGGTSFGDVPLHRLWYVGGPSTVRGFAPEERLAGGAYWRGRAEIATEKPAARLVLFTDVGSANVPADLSLDPMLVSAGLGFSTLDGLVRLDLSRAIRGGDGWAVRLRLDGML